MPKVNGKKVTTEKALEMLEDPNTIVEQLSIDLPSTKKKDCPVTMEGFDIPKEMLIEWAEASTKLNAAVTVSFKKCAKLGNKTVVITVKDHDHQD